MKSCRKFFCKLTILVVLCCGFYVVSLLELGQMGFESFQPFTTTLKDRKTSNITHNTLFGAINPVEEVMSQRRQHLKEACSMLDYNFNRTIGPTRIFYAKTYHFAYCSIPKTGCTNFKKILWLLNGKVGNITDIERYANSSEFHQATRKLFETYKWRGLPEIPISYTKFIVVRHPFERLLSAYHNKLVPAVPGRQSQYHVLGEEIRKRYGATKERKELIGVYPTFEEFVDYVIDQTFSGKRINDHFLNYNYLCWPCLIYYDTIAHMETLERDIKYMLNKIKAPENYFQLEPGYSVDGSGKPQTSREKTLKEFSKLPLKKVALLYGIYQNSFLLFGYEASDYFKRN